MQGLGATLAFALGAAPFADCATALQISFTFGRVLVKFVGTHAE
jgi:hypothetical protein